MTPVNSYTGLFLSLEGPDGSGKTTNAKVLAKHFEARGFETVLTREPGGTPLAETIRNVVLQNTGGEEATDSIAEMLLFGAARAQHIAEKILPALKLGKIVICDRFNISTSAYQGYGRGLHTQVELMEQIVHPNLYPDHVIFFNLPFEESLKRTSARNGVSGYADRFDNAELEFKENVYYGYVKEIQDMMSRNPLKVVQVDAMCSLEYISTFLEGVADHLITSNNLRHARV